MSLIAWFPLNNNLNNQGTGTATLNSGGSFSYGTGKVTNKCGNFTDNSAYCSTSLSSLNLSSATTLSFSAWYNNTTLTGGSGTGARHLFEFYQDSSHRFLIEITSANKLSYYNANIAGSGAIDSGSVATISQNTWFHFCMIVNNGTASFYVNGIKCSLECPFSGYTGTFYLCTGGSGTSSFNFKGYCNDARLYDHALSTKEVKQLAKGLCLHYSFNFEDLYTPVEYIQSTGTQYIDTGVSDTGDIQIDCNIKFTTTALGNQIWGFGGNGWMGLGTDGSSWWECSSLGTITVDTLYETTYHKVGTTTTRIVNGTSLTGSNGYPTSQYTAKLFATQGWEGTTDIYYYCAQKMYSAKIYQFGTLVRDFIPAVRNIDGKPGLYDRVNNVFYTNVGSGEFLTPEGYAKDIKAISTNGSASYNSSTGTLSFTGSTTYSWAIRGAYSNNSYSACYVSFTPNSTSNWIMVGLGKSKVYKFENTDTNWYIESGGRCQIYEKSTLIGSYGNYSGTTLFELIYDGSYVYYYKDHVLQRSVAITGPLYLCIDSYSDKTIDNLVFRAINNTTQDSSGYGNIGTISNVSLLADTPLGNQSVGCNGSTSKVVTTLAPKDIKTVSMWIKTNFSSAPSSNQIVFGAGNGNVAGFGFYNTTGFISSSNTYRPIFPYNGFNFGQWNHICLVYTSSTSKLYINGNESTSTGGTNYWTFNNNELTIGCRYVSGYTGYFNGKIADFRTYATALSAADIKQLYESKASIDNNGAIHCNCIEEHSLNTQLPTSTGIVKTKNLSEASGNCELFGGYTELEYLEATGNNCVINTGYADGLKVTVDCHMYASTASGNYWYGSTQAHGNMMYNGLYNLTALEYNWLTISRTSSNDLVMTQRIDGSKTVITMNGVTSTVDTGTETPTGNMYIFGCNNGARFYANSNLKCYYFKIYDNNKLVRDFIPVKRNKDNVLGLYDKVENKFYPNAGSGTFTAGNTKGTFSSIKTNQIIEGE